MKTDYQRSLNYPQYSKFPVPHITLDRKIWLGIHVCEACASKIICKTASKNVIINEDKVWMKYIQLHQRDIIREEAGLSYLPVIV